MARCGFAPQVGVRRSAQSVCALDRRRASDPAGGKLTFSSARRQRKSARGLVLLLSRALSPEWRARKPLARARSRECSIPASWSTRTSVVASRGGCPDTFMRFNRLAVLAGDFLFAPRRAGTGTWERLAVVKLLSRVIWILADGCAGLFA